MCVVLLISMLVVVEGIAESVECVNVGIVSH